MPTVTKGSIKCKTYVHKNIQLYHFWSITFLGMFPVQTLMQPGLHAAGLHAFPSAEHQGHSWISIIDNKYISEGVRKPIIYRENSFTKAGILKQSETFSH